jgi:hypothetical protein
LVTEIELRQNKDGITVGMDEKPIESGFRVPRSHVTRFFFTSLRSTDSIHRLRIRFASTLCPFELLVSRLLQQARLEVDPVRTMPGAANWCILNQDEGFKVIET